MKPRDEVIVAASASPYIRLAWASISKRKRLKIRLAGDPDGAIGFTDVASLLSSRTRAIFLSAADWTGQRCAVEEISSFGQEVGVRVVVDATEILRCGEAIDVGAMKCTGVFADGKVVGGLPGRAFLWLEVDAVEAEEAELIESGMTCVASAVGLAAAMQEFERDAASNEMGLQLGSDLYNDLRKIDGVRVMGDEAECGRLAIACFAVENISVGDVVSELTRRGFFVEEGHEGHLRVAFHARRDGSDEVKRFLRTLRGIAVAR